MKLGSKSNLISAYSALFTVAFGVLAYDFVRRSQPDGNVARVEAKVQVPEKKDVPAATLASR